MIGKVTYTALVANVEVIGQINTGIVDARGHLLSMLIRDDIRKNFPKAKSIHIMTL